MASYSVLDLAPIVVGGDARTALERSVDLARHAEQWGYRRFWLAEHHNMPGIASSATAVVIGHIAGGTSTIRVGAGGIMLPNHAPLVIAEQFGTLETLYPGRIDLGLGRAPGTDPLTARALRRMTQGSADQFPEDVVELLTYLDDPAPGQRVSAVPGVGTKVPVWILGSSLFGASLSARLGLPYAFASHFAPAQLMAAIEVYRKQFRPSKWLAKPYVMLGVNVIAAASQEEAAFLQTSLQQVFVALRSGQPGPLPAPVQGYEAKLGYVERMLLQELLSCSWAGTIDTVRQGLHDFLARTGADELMINTHVYDHQARLTSLQLTAEALS